MTDARSATAIDGAAVSDALTRAAARCGRLSDEQVLALRRRRKVAVGTPLAVVLAFAITVVGGRQPTTAPAAPVHWTRELATRPGQRGAAVLADGSTIRLNGASRIRIDYTDRHRSARLLAGQAFFDVRHDASRPFVVRAGTSEARVLGTAFDLDLTRRQVALAVYRGAVGFDPVHSAHGVVVRAGFRSRVRDGAVAAPTRFDPALPDWRQGWIDTTGMRLDELVDVLGRSGGSAIVRPTGRLAALTIAGRFRTDRPAALLGAIGEGFGFTVVEGRKGLVLRASD